MGGRGRGKEEGISTKKAPGFTLVENQSLEQVTLPSSLQSIAFGYGFNRSLEQATLPSSLQSIAFGYVFD